MTQSTFEKVRSILEDQLGVDPSEITPTADLIDDLGADSLDTIEIVAMIEEAFNIIVPDEDAEKIKTVEDAVKYIESQNKNSVK